MSYASAEEQRRHSSRPDESKPKKRRKFGFLWFREYTPTVVVWEVFFRTRMGERDFGVRLFLGGLAVLVLIQTLSFQSMLGYDYFEINPDKDFYITSPFDWVIAAYLIMGGWHLFEQRRLFAKGKSSYSYYMGSSRLRPIGKGFFLLVNLLISLPFRLSKAKPFQFSSTADYYFSYYLLEPLAAFILTIIACSSLVFNSKLVLALGLMGTGQLWWQNVKKVRETYLSELNRKDVQKMSEQIEFETKLRDLKQAEKASPPPLPIKVPESMPSLPKNDSQRSSLNVNDMLKEQNAKRKNKGDTE